MAKPVLHVDGDSFFASCEASLDTRLKGKPLVTGKERGIASSMSKEAKALGISRGMPIFQIRKLFPQVIILSSDYGIYETFARRMYTIVKRHADEVEEYSIDECFARLSSWDEAIVSRIKRELQSELDITFSLGLAQTKVLAKLASSKNKPDGLTILPARDVEKFLEDVDVGKIWGIGPATARELRSLGIKTALDLRQKEEGWAMPAGRQGRDNLDKHAFEIWHELNGRQIFPVSPGGEEGPKSIQATRTFSPPTRAKRFLLSELSKNIENAAVKLRQDGLAARKVSFFIKTQEFRYHRGDCVFDIPVFTPAEIVRHVQGALPRLYEPHTLYRATGVTLSGLVPWEMAQSDLFDSQSRSERWREVFRAVDKIDGRYGSHTLTLASSLEAYKRRGGATAKRLNIPYMGEVS